MNREFQIKVAVIVMIIVSIIMVVVKCSYGAYFQSGGMKCETSLTKIDNQAAVVVATITNETTTPIRGAYYTVFIDESFVVTYIMARINDAAFSLLAQETDSGLPWMPAGDICYRFVTDYPTASNWTIQPGSTLEISYEISNAQDVEKDLESSWVGYSHEAEFGYSDDRFDLKPPARMSIGGIVEDE